MLSDPQLAEYLEGVMDPKLAKQFEKIAASKSGVIAEIVAQQRMDHALQALVSSRGKAGRALKQAILDEANTQRKTRGDSNPSPHPNGKRSDWSILLPAISLILILILTALLWYFAPSGS